MKGELTGKCLCGAVTYTLSEGFRMNPYACHCTECQSRTGSAFSEHMLFMLSDLQIIGELDVARYTQPSGAQSEIFGCATCKARTYAVSNTREGMGSLRCGTLDNSASVVPAAHFWVRSKQPWIGLPAGAKTMDEQPRTNEEWIEQVGIA